jgi:hypothetical protein
MPELTQRQVRAAAALAGVEPHQVERVLAGGEPVGGRLGRIVAALGYFGLELAEVLTPDDPQRQPDA